MLKWGIIVGLLITLLAFTGGCVPAAPEGTSGGFDWTIIIFVVVIFGIFYLLMVRPQRRKQQQMDVMIRELKKGDKVVTSGGIFGQVESISEDSVVLKIESGGTIRVSRRAITGRRDEELIQRR